MECTWRENRFS